MRPLFLLALALTAIIATACGRDGSSARAPRTAAASSVTRGARCPSTTFDAFLTAFAEHPAIQQDFTRDPLAYVTMDDSGDEPTPHERRFTRDSLPTPLLPPAVDRARDGLELRVDSADASRRVVTLVKPDTDVQIQFTFERRSDACWELTRYYDQTL